MKIIFHVTFVLIKLAGIATAAPKNVKKLMPKTKVKVTKPKAIKSKPPPKLVMQDNLETTTF